MIRATGKLCTRTSLLQSHFSLSARDTVEHPLSRGYIYIYISFLVLDIRRLEREREGARLIDTAKGYIMEYMLQ